MKLTKAQVEHVAKLASLPLTEDEIEKYSEQLSKILDYVDVLNTVDTKDVKPTYNTTGLKNIWAEDESGKSLTQEEVLSNGKNSDSYFVTKGVFKDE